MKQLCLKCFNKINNENKTKNEVYTQWDFCDNCGKNAPCVLGLKSKEKIDIEEGLDDE